MYIPLFAASLAAQDPDALYADRANLASARQAVDIWSARVAAGGSGAFESAWKLARVCYWLGSNGTEAERRNWLERGMEAARQAVTAMPERPEGHFWLAANMGTLAESFGVRAGLKYRKPIREELETVLRIDPGFMQGSADRALGRWYDKVPRLFGGNAAKAEEHLRASLKYDPHSTITHYFLAELYVDEGRKADARAELQQVIDAPLSTDYAPEDRNYKEKARQLLAKL
ncbi:MAG TPA: TRAP transporter TatT component family protein [Vicinamibacterales bacterium]